MQTLSRCHRDRCIILPSRIGWRSTSFIVCSRRIRHWQFKPARKVKSCCAQSSAAKEPSRTCRWSAVIPCLCEPLCGATVALPALCSEWRGGRSGNAGYGEFCALGRIGRQQLAVWHLALARSEEHTSELQSRVDLVC